MRRFLNGVTVGLKTTVLRFLLTLKNSIGARRYVPYTNQQVYDFANTGVFNTNSRINYGLIYHQWEEADNYWRIGEYQKSVSLREMCLSDLYNSQDISEDDYFPPILSTSWTSAFGHVGSLGVFRAAQKLGYIPETRRVALVKDPNSLKNLNRIFAKDFVLSPLLNGHASLEHPSQWHISERLQSVKSNNGFICLYKLHELVFSDHNHKVALPSVDADYIASSKFQLEKVGLPEDAWFVAFHVRDNFGKFDARSASVSSFDLAIDEIIRLGGWVIQFGINSRQGVTPRKGLINLEEVVQNHLDFHLYLLSQCKFLLTTNSGPSVIAWSLGTPVLQTNTTSIARNILRASSNSLFLPKHYQDSKGRKLSYREISSGNLGYSESSTKELDALGVRIIENSPREILDATKEILGKIDGYLRPNEFKPALERIRLESSCVGFGEVAISFMESNPEWIVD